MTLSNLAIAVDIINNAFDGCRISMGYNHKPLACEEDRAVFIFNPYYFTSSGYDIIKVITYIGSSKRTVSD